MLADDQWKWSKFVEIGNNIHKMRGQVRILEANRALVYAKQLIINEFIPNLPIKDQQLYGTLLPKIAEYLDGKKFQDAVKEYFLIQHCKASLDENLFNISFALKKSGIQTGFTCDVSNGTNTLRYYIKTHQHGPTQDTGKSISPPDIKEMFIYKILYSIGIGPLVHFIVPSHGSKRTIYIATLDCHLVLLSNLTKETANYNALLQLDLISRILCLRDCATNSSNCGQVGETAMIVDFRIESQVGYVKEDILDKFYQGNSEYNYAGLMETAVKTPNIDKMVIMKKSLQNWMLLEKIEQVEMEVYGMAQKYGDKIIFDNDLQRYVRDVKATINVLIKS